MPVTGCVRLERRGCGVCGLCCCCSRFAWRLDMVGSSARDVEDGRKHEFVTFVARRTGHVLF